MKKTELKIMRAKKDREKKTRESNGKNRHRGTTGDTQNPSAMI